MSSCGNKTTDPSGYCHHHDQADAAHSDAIKGLPIPLTTLQDPEIGPEWDEDGWSQESATAWTSRGFSLEEANDWYYTLTGQIRGRQGRVWIMDVNEAAEYASAWRDHGYEKPPSGLFQMKVLPLIDSDFGDTRWSWWASPQEWEYRLFPESQWESKMAHFNRLFPTVDDEIAFWDEHGPTLADRGSSYVGVPDSIGSAWMKLYSSGRLTESSDWREVSRLIGLSSSTYPPSFLDKLPEGMTISDRLAPSIVEGAEEHEINAIKDNMNLDPNLILSVLRSVKVPADISDRDEIDRKTLQVLNSWDERGWPVESAVRIASVINMARFDEAGEPWKPPRGYYTETDAASASLRQYASTIEDLAEKASGRNIHPSSNIMTMVSSGTNPGLKPGDDLTTCIEVFQDPSPYSDETLTHAMRISSASLLAFYKGTGPWTSKDFVAGLAEGHYGTEEVAKIQAPEGEGYSSTAILRALHDCDGDGETASLMLRLQA